MEVYAKGRVLVLSQDEKVAEPEEEEEPEEGEILDEPLPKVKSEPHMPAMAALPQLEDLIQPSQQDYLPDARSFLTVPAGEWHAPGGSLLAPPLESVEDCDWHTVCIP
jgi:hypothetical protein